MNDSLDNIADPSWVGSAAIIPQGNDVYLIRPEWPGYISNEPARLVRPRLPSLRFHRRGRADRLQHALFRFEPIAQSVRNDRTRDVNVIVAFRLAIQLVGDGLQDFLFMAFLDSAATAKSWPKEIDTANGGTFLLRSAVEASIALLTAAILSLPTRHVDGVRPDADRHVQGFAKHFPRTLLILRHRHRQRVEIHARMVGRVPFDSRKARLLLADGFQFLERSFDLGRLLDMNAGDKRQRIGARIEAMRRRRSALL